MLGLFTEDEKKNKRMKYLLTLVVCVTVGPVKSVTCLYSRDDSINWGIISGNTLVSLNEVIDQHFLRLKEKKEEDQKSIFTRNQTCTISNFCFTFLYIIIRTSNDD